MPDVFDRLKAALSSRYAIEREIGSGGMATVYLAEDLKLHRKVALKVLKPDLAAALGPERFLQEIEIAAGLHHPHILPLHDSGDADGFLYYVMPYEEGQSLREKLAKEGELPIAEAVRILRDVADALSHAHKHSVVHRDIKPDNVMLSDRHALVADFGVAKAVSEATGRHKLTTEGMALGTPAYMAPEQAAADPHVDHRADIYALGAVAYELLTGRPPFTGTAQQEILSAHVMQTPEPVTKYRASVPPQLEQLVMKCLEKKAADRWQTAEELIPQLEALTTPSGGLTPTGTVPTGAVRGSGLSPAAIAVVIATIVVLVAGVTWVLLGRRGSTPIIVGQTTQVTFDPGVELDPAISPDGRRVAYVAGPMGQRHIFLRSVAGGRAVDLTAGLPGNHRMPKWSPDGTQILFAAPGGTYLVPELGGIAGKIIDSYATGAAWFPDGQRIAYSVGGEIRVAYLDGRESEDVVDDFEPHSVALSSDGSLLAYVSGNSGYVVVNTYIGNVAPSALRALVMPDGTPVTLTENQRVYQSPVWLPEGDGILYISDEGGARDIYQLSLDAAGAVAGPPIRLTTGLEALTMSISADGRLLAYSEFRYEANIWSIPIPSSGMASVSAATQITTGNQAIEGMSVSPDGRWLVFDSNRRGNQDIYLMELPDGEPQQLTDDPADDLVPSWSPDGEEIVFYSFRHGSRDLFVMAADGSSEVRLTDDPAQERYPDWSPDGNSIVFQSDKSGSHNLWVLSREGDGRPWGDARQLTDDGGAQPRWSPSGAWIAYQSGGTATKIAPDGGEPVVLGDDELPTRGITAVFPEWSRDGSEVYFKTRDSVGVAGFWTFPVSGGSPRQLVVLDDPILRSVRPEFTTDGTRFFFTMSRQESDIWVMELEVGR
ncbi:protein kinase [Gemmatimonadota bacterium]